MGLGTVRVNTRKLEHGFRRISARIPYTLPLRARMFQLSGFYCRCFGAESVQEWDSAQQIAVGVPWSPMPQASSPALLASGPIGGL